MRIASPSDLRVRVDRRVRADEGGVEGAGEDRLDGLGAGVEGRRLERDVGAERLLEQAVLDADDRRGVGDVREVAEAQRHVGCRGAVSAGAAESAGLRCRQVRCRRVQCCRRRRCRQRRCQRSCRPERRRCSTRRRRCRRRPRLRRGGRSSEGRGEVGNGSNAWSRKYNVINGSTTWKPDFFCQLLTERLFDRRFGARIPAVPTRRTPPRRGADGPRSGTQSVERAIAVLECFASSDRSLGLTEIARGVGLTPSTAHRPASCAHRRRLCRAGADDRALSAGDRHSRARATSARTLRLQPGSPGVGATQPPTTGESASLGIRRSAEVVVIERASSDAALRFDHRTGAEIAMHASAMGKVLLAFSAERHPNEVGRLGRLERFTDATITTPNGMIDELERVVVAGHATNIEERLRRRLRHRRPGAIARAGSPTRRSRCRARASGSRQNGCASWHRS